MVPRPWAHPEVKWFIEKAEDMVPFLLQIAALPAECMPEMATAMNGDGEMEMEEDDEYSLTWKTWSARRSWSR